MKGKIIIIVAPSGTGKSTLIEKLQKEVTLKWSVSCTTRPKREGEVHGKDYFFIGKEEFKTRIKNNEFLEWAEVHSNYYGTLKSFVDEGLARGDFLLFDLDVQGCDSIKKIYNQDAKVIFIEPPSVEELEKRLIKRGTDSMAVIKERVQNAREEIKRKNDFDYNLLNDNIENAYPKLKQIVLEIMGTK
jgi:guanylate kinase